MTQAELSIVHKGRDVVFNVLSRVFIDMPSDDLDLLISVTEQYLSEMADGSDNVSFINGADALGTFLETEGLENSREDRARDFTRLYVTGRDTVPVYESVYLSPEHIMKQDAWSEVKTFYYENFFRRSQWEHAPEDHIALELQFMGLLCKRAADLAEERDREGANILLNVQLDFYEKHIFKWIPLFCDLTFAKTPVLSTGFYPAYALVLKGFIEEDRAFLKSILGK